MYGALDRTQHTLLWCRLKSQIVSEQDAEDDKLQWKVEAEVRIAIKAAEAAKEAASARASGLRQQLDASEKQKEALESTLTAWEAAVAERDIEIRNLQVISCLGDNCNKT